MAVPKDDPVVAQATTWKTGYHYTSWSAWLKIRTEGLRPQKVAYDKVEALLATFAELGEETDWDRRGIWIWRQRLSEGAHVGSVLFQVATKGEPTVALLKVRYLEEHCLRTRYGALNLRHSGKLGSWDYHTGTDEECAQMVRVPIPPKQLKLIASYDITKELRGRGRVIDERRAP